MKRKEMAEYYVELQVGLRHGQWYERLKQSLRPYNVNWQGKYYHITMAFIKDMNEADADKLNKALRELLANKKACRETFGRVGAFTTSSGKEHIVYLIPKIISENLETLVSSVRQCCKDNAIAIEPEYRHHITLGRININAVTLDKLQALTGDIQMPDYVLCLDEVNLIRRVDHIKIGSYKLN